jgi:hypothetical protein
MVTNTSKGFGLTICNSDRRRSRRDPHPPSRWLGTLGKIALRGYAVVPFLKDLGGTPKRGTIAMRIEYLAAIAIAAFAAVGIGLAVHSVGSLPSEKQSTPAAVQLETSLAESVDPFLHRSGS